MITTVVRIEIGGLLNDGWGRDQFALALVDNFHWSDEFTFNHHQISLAM